MATSYTSESIYDSIGNGRRMYVTCSQTKGTSSENKSTVSWTLTTTGGGSTYYDTGPTTLNIAGAQRYYKARTAWSSFAFPAKAGSTSGSFTVNHNTDGSVGGIAVELKTAIYTGTVSTKSGTWYMDSIARYFSSTPTLTLSSKTETSMNFSWRTSETCSSVDVYYKKTSESKYISANKYNNSTGATSGTFSISGLAANTAYHVYIVAKRKDSGLTSNSSTSQIDTYDYPKITSVTTGSLTIGSQQVLGISNPLGRSIVIKMYKTNTSGTVLYTSSAITGTSHSFTPTASTLYASIPSAQSANCVYSVICSAVSSTKTTTGTYSYKIKGDEYPTFSNTQVSTYDASSEVTAITGQTAAGNWLVQSLSKMKLTINSAATGSNSATISSYKVTFNKIEKTLSVGTTGGTWEAINASGTQTATIVVTDSRGLTRTVTKDITYVAYAAPSITLTGGRQNNYGTTVNLAVTYKSSAVNSKNTITVTWSGAGKSGTFTKAGTTAGNATKSATVTGVDNNTAYNFTATITDKFGKSANATLPISIGMPIMFVDSTQLGVGVNTFPQGQGLWVDGQGNMTGGLTVGGNFKAQEIKTLRLNSTSNVASYTSFARLHKTNPTERGAMTFLVSALGNFGGTIPGTCLVTFSNRGSAPTVKATWLQAHNSGTVKFGYYTSGDYYYLGVYTDTYSYSRDIILLSSDVANGAGGPQAVKVWSTGSTAPSGWTAVTPTYAGITKLDAWPVGSVYLSYKGKSPASLFGGTWEQIKSVFLYATNSTSGDVGSTGNGTGTSTGSYSGTTGSTTLSLSQIPSHSHTVNNHEHHQRTIGNDGNINPWVAGAIGGGSGGVYTRQQVSWYNSGKAAVYTYGSSPGTNAQGGGGGHTHPINSHSHTIPYVAIYVWKRTA